MLGNPFPLESCGKPRRCRVHGHRQMRTVQVEGDFPGFVRPSPPPGLVREEGENVNSGQRRLFRMYSDSGFRWREIELGRRELQDQTCLVHDFELGQHACRFLRLLEDDRDAVSAAFHQKRTMRGTRNVADGDSPEHGGNDLIARSLARIHALDRHPVWKLAGRINLKPVREHR